MDEEWECYYCLICGRVVDGNPDISQEISRGVCKCCGGKLFSTGLDWTYFYENKAPGIDTCEEVRRRYVYDSPAFEREKAYYRQQFDKVETEEDYELLKKYTPNKP